MANFLDSFKDIISDAVVHKVSDMIGTDNSSATSAIGKFLPAILGGLISKGSSVSGAGSLIDLFKSKNLGDDNLSDLAGLLGNKDKTNSWLEMGSSLLGSLFGSKQSSVLETLLGLTGIKKEGGSTLLKFLAPLVLSKLAGMVFKNKWSASQLSSYLGEQKSGVLKALPAFGNLLDFDHDHDHKTVTHKKDSGLGWLKWLIPLLLLGALIWYLTKDGCGKKVDEEAVMIDTTATEVTDTMATTDVIADETAKIDYTTYKVSANGDILDGTGKIVFKGGTYGLDATGNLIDDNGKILIKAASIPTTLLDSLKKYLGKYPNSKLTVDTKGNLVDETGKIIVSKGSFIEKDGFYYDKQGNKLGRIWKKIVEAVTKAAEKTVEGMKALFTSMVKKTAGTKTNYELSNIEFNPENHRITNFSKAEVEGLAAALKENVDGKIVVQAYTSDGKNSKENKELSKTRAQVVHDMLVTLGVSKKQITFEGMGDGSNKVEIKIK